MSDWIYEAVGLTKREIFAAMAMQGLLSSPEPENAPGAGDVAHVAVMYADALIKELGKIGDGFPDRDEMARLDREIKEKLSKPW